MTTCEIQLNHVQEKISVLQLTDSHLFADENGTLLGVKTADSFAAVLSSILNQAIPLDFVIFTGDISQDYSVGSYERFASMIAPLKVPVFFVPGNHDDGPLMYRIFDQYGVKTNKSIVCGNWHFILLNSEVYSRAHGWVEKSELDFLCSQCNQYPQHHTAVVVHHLPQLVGSRWLDTQTMHNQDEFNACISNFPQIKLVLSGHVHQEVDRIVNNIRYIASPSTSIQFEPLSFDFALDALGPGWRYLQFNKQGHIDTQVYRLPPGRFVPDSGVVGY